MPINPVNQNVKLEYNTSKHDRIRNFLRNGIDTAIKQLTPWHDQIRYHQGQQHLWIKKPNSEGGSRTQHNRDSKGNQQYETILIPYSYATTAAAHMYASSVFLSRSPIFQFTGRHGETQDQEMLMEAIVNYQVVGAEMRKSLFHWLYDPFRYGAGVVGTYWDQEIFPESTIVEIPDPINPDKTIRQLVTEPTIGYQGNRLYNVRLLDFFWDTKVGLVDFQKGEFAGENLYFAWNKVIEMHARGMISDTNMEVLRRKSLQKQADTRIIGNENIASITEEDSVMLQGADFRGLTAQGLPVKDSTWVIVPKAWGLSNSPIPEKWQFGLAADEVVIYARPSGAPHNRFPYSAIVYEIDTFAKYPRALGDFSDPFERVMSWMFNSHMYNVRKHLNNNMIIDPSKVLARDFKQRSPGSPIRLKPSAYGTDTRTVATQLNVGDVTSQHLSDMRSLEQVAQKITGISDNVMGAVNPGGRKTATEIRSANTFSTNRLKTIVEWFSATGFSDLSRQMTTNTQKYLSGEITVKILGDMLKSPEQFQEYMIMTKDSIAGFFDFEPIDGSLPADRFAQANLMKEIYSLIIGNPVLQNQYDLPALTNHIASLLGARNLNRFRLQAQVEQPGQIEQGQQQGNIVPIGAQQQ